MYYRNCLKSCGFQKEVRKMLEQKKFCPVCGELAAVLEGDPEKYGDRAMDYHRFIATKYCCQECRDIMNRQAKYLSGKRCRGRDKECRKAAFDVIDTLQREADLSRAYIAKLEARLC